ncbi:hypothetical protein [uncultured Cedecea sp.]|uniref:hypothetical protein n=1 Tax=uncultured Cedecea sp. TaxID=988762 RepID=UPI00261AC6A6|nr:hypothetical protein [uncultured Cedecea sp.]
MQETTTLNALILCRARNLITEYGWPSHTDVDQRDPENRHGWINIYVRLDASDIVNLLPLLCPGDVPEQIQRAVKKIAGTKAQIIVSGGRYSSVPQWPGEDTAVTFPWAGEWLNESEIKAVINCLSSSIQEISRQVLVDSRHIKAALTTRSETLFRRQTRNFSLVVKETDMPCWMDEDDEKLQAVLDAIIEKGARFSSVECFVVSEKVDQILSSGVMCDVLRIPGEHPRKWIDLTVVRDTIKEARAEITSIRSALIPMKPD